MNLRLTLFSLFLVALHLGLCQPAAADGYSSPELRRHLKNADSPEYLFARIDHPVKPGMDLLTDVALEAGLSIIARQPLPNLRIPTDITKILGSDPDAKMARIAAEMGLVCVKVQNVVCVIPQENMHVRGLFSGTLAPWQACKDLDFIQYSYLEYSPGSKEPSAPQGTTLESSEPLTLRGKNVPMTWLVEVLATAVKKPVRSDSPLKGHLYMEVRQADPSLVLNLIMALSGRIVMERSPRFEVLLGTPERTGLFDYGQVMEHPALEWLAYSREKLKTLYGPASHPYIAAVLQRCVQMLMAGNFASAERMASALLMHRRDLWEARYLRALALAGMAEFDKALQELGRIRGKVGQDPVLKNVMEELEILSRYPLVRSRVHFLRE